MEKDKGKVKLRDEQLDPISGGYEEEGSEEVTGGMIEICRYCGRPIRNGNLMDHDENCYVVKTRQLQPF
ncbi:MAG: hypothetical protein IJI13_03755 [Oscillospiraceae bacterium]|nr:hypothetical protein [Oscillospiraceae bacterium]